MSTPVRRPYARRLGAAERRTQLLDAALHLAATEGMNQVTMEAVARAAGVTKPVLYELFPQRGALYEALLDREETRALEQLREVVPLELGTLPGHVLLARSLSALVTSVQVRPDAWTLLLQAPESMPAEVRVRYERRRTEIVDAVTTLLAAGRSRRRHSGPADDELLAESIVALGELIGRLVLRRPDKYPEDRLVSYVTELAARVLPPESADAP